jgi:AbrB family looped-hinge helix DNA binding protein
MKTRVSEKGQVTIPKKLRDQLGIRMGDELDFDVEQGRLVATKVADQDPFDAVWGTLRLPAGMSVDEAIDEMRGPALPPLPGELGR